MMNMQPAPQEIGIRPSVMATLCNFAAVENNKLFILGGGVDHFFFPIEVPAPWGVVLAIGGTVSLPLTTHEADHSLMIDLVNEDGQPIILNQANGNTEPFHVEMQMHLVPNESVVVGEQQNISFAFNFPGLTIPSLGVYVFIISVDGIEATRLVMRANAIVTV
jgi:hypothetical protein